MENKELTQITQSGYDRIFKSQLNKGKDADSIHDWMEETFEVISETEYRKNEYDKAVEKGWITADKEE